jgi:hypothetical protein
MIFFSLDENSSSFSVSVRNERLAVINSPKNIFHETLSEERYGSLTKKCQRDIKKRYS